jgi:hypothetical protein
MNNLLKRVKRKSKKIVREYWHKKPIWTPRRLFISLENVEVKRPVFFLGTQGGGLTLLTRMLRRNGEFVTIGGGAAFWTGNDEMDKFHVAPYRLPEDFALRSPRYNNMTGAEKEHPKFGVERTWVYASDEMLPDYRKTEEDYSEDTARQLRNFMRRSIRAHSDDGRKARFLDMSQSYALKVPLLRKIFPDATFVVVARNPFVMCWREATRRPEIDDKYKDWNTRPSLEEAIRIAAEHWANTYSIALADLEELGGGLTVHFEEALRQPEQTMRAITDHVGASYNDDMIPQSHHRLPLGSKERSKWYPIRTDVNSKYLDSVTDEAIEIIASTIRERSRTKTYEDVIARYEDTVRGASSGVNV